MRPHRTHRLPHITCLTALVAVPSGWIYREIRQQHLNRALITAIKRSDPDSVDRLLAAGADANTRDTPETHEPLLQKLKHLLHPKQDLSPTALIVCLAPAGTQADFRPGTLRMVEALLSDGADVDAHDSDGNAPICELFTYDCGHTIPAPVTGMPGIQLVYIYRTENLQLLQTLLAAHAKPDACQAGGLLPLHAACSFDSAISLRLLLEHGANIESRDQRGNTPLMTACWGQHTEIVRALLDHRANVNVHDLSNNTPLAVARDNGDSDTVELLITHGAKQ